MAKELFWYVYNELKSTYPKFFASSRSYPGLPPRIKRTLVAFDSTTIQLTADSLDWAKHRRRKAAAKMHTGLNMQSFLPSVIIVKSAKDSAPKTAPELCARLLAGEIAVFDKAYVDFKHLNLLDGRGVFYVTRKKENMLYKVMGQHTIPAARGWAPFFVINFTLQEHRGAGSDEIFRLFSAGKFDFPTRRDILY